MNAGAKPSAVNQSLPPEERQAGVHAQLFQELKDKIARLERTGGGLPASRPRRPQERVVSLDLPALDDHLPWGGLLRGALHEVAGEGTDREEAANAAGFAALWLAKLQAAGPVLWIARAAAPPALDLYAHGLRQQRLDPDRLILVAARRDDEALWAMEEGLKAKSLGAVLGEIGKLDLTASRRLQLAAEASGVTAFVLRRWRVMRQAEREAKQPIAAVTRWRVAALPGQGDTRWRVELARCRGGKPNIWILNSGILEKADGSDGLHAAPLPGDLAAVLGHRSPAAGAASDRKPERKTDRRAAG